VLAVLCGSVRYHPRPYLSVSCQRRLSSLAIASTTGATAYAAITMMTYTANISFGMAAFAFGWIRFGLRNPIGTIAITAGAVLIVAGAVAIGITGPCMLDVVLFVVASLQNRARSGRLVAAVTIIGVADAKSA